MYIKAVKTTFVFIYKNRNNIYLGARLVWRIAKDVHCTLEKIRSRKGDILISKA